MPPGQRRPPHLRLQQQWGRGVAQQVLRAEPLRQQLLQAVRLILPVPEQEADALSAAELAVKLTAMAAGCRGYGDGFKGSFPMLEHVNDEKLFRMDAAGQREPPELEVDAHVHPPRGAEANGPDVEEGDRRACERGGRVDEVDQQLVLAET